MAVQKNKKIINDWLADQIFYGPSLIKNETKITGLAEQKVLQLFAEASQRVPAYKDFLKKNKVNPLSIKSIKDFQQLPATTKKNYIELYSAESRCWDGSLENMYMISTSSGTTGQPHFWPRDLETEIDGAKAHEFIFRELCQVNQKKTLLINGFAMGNWIAGTFTLASANWVALKGYPLTTMTPGYQTESVVEVIQKCATQFEQIIVTGHTPFLKEVVELAIEKKVDFHQIRVILLGTGQSITENWRDYMLELTGNKEPIKVFNVYGSADAALMGTETPFTIFLRRLFTQDMTVSQKIFHDDRLPSLYSFDPRLTYFETINHELHVTKRTGCPLIRYNMLDNGGVYAASALKELIGKKVLSKIPSSSWSFPFVYLFGRDKFMVKVYGANIYTEHVQAALNHRKLQKILTGRFLLEMTFDQDQDPQLICRIELNKKINPSDVLHQLIRKTFIQEVTKVNTEYYYVINQIGEKAKPVILLHSHGDERYFPTTTMKKTS